VSEPAQRARYRTRLLIEPAEAATVAMISHWRVHEGLSPKAITVRLVDNRHPPPREHTTGREHPWTTDRVTTILRNPKYLGRQVWGRQHRHSDTPPSTWVWSTTQAHPQIIDPATFTAAQHPWRQEPPQRQKRHRPGVNRKIRRPSAHR
jgi:hypothetical protein